LRRKLKATKSELEIVRRRCENLAALEEKGSEMFLNSWSTRKRN